MAILRAYAFKIDTHMTDDAFTKLPYVFPNEPIPTVDVSRSRLQFLSGFKPIRYDCCINSCCCFVGPHKDCTQCPFCGEDRNITNTAGNKMAHKVFNYLPLIPRLVTMYANAENVQEMRYWAFEHAHTPGKVTDIFDSHIYRRLLGKRVVIDGKQATHQYFSDPRDVALGLSTDGFGPFKRRTTTAWPLIIFDYNLPPEKRFHNKNIISLGVIPGPKKPIDMDSFLWPAFEEFIRLQLGVRAFDALSSELFLLHAYLILVFGDIPAISMLMRMTGHNGYSPCRQCKILGVRMPNSRSTTHYVPLNRSRHPEVRSGTGVAAYDPAALPLHTEEELLQQAQEVRDAPSEAQRNRLSKAYGIKGIPLLSYLKSLLFPWSFPYDFMHLIWENLIPNLILLWTGEFKGLDKGKEDYEFAPKVWQAICAAGAAAGSSIPSVFGACTPNIATNKSACSAEVWSFWALYVGPILLLRHFQHQRYYNHFVRLVKLLHMCLQFEITTDEIQTIRQGFIQWVSEYET